KRLSIHCCSIINLLEMKLFVFYCRLLMGVAVLLLSSCYTNRPQRINCRGHEIKQYYSNHTSPDTILIYGRIKLCETGKLLRMQSLYLIQKAGKLIMPALTSEATTNWKWRKGILTERLS